MSAETEDSKIPDAILEGIYQVPQGTHLRFFAPDGGVFGEYIFGPSGSEPLYSASHGHPGALRAVCARAAIELFVTQALSQKPLGREGE